MGLFHLLCPASRLGIVTEEVVLVLVAQGDEGFAPVAPPIRGDYDTYGSIEGIDFGPVTERILAGLNESWAKGDLLVPDPDPGNPFGAELSPAGLRGLLEHVRQGGILESVRVEGVTASAMVRMRGRSLGFVMILAPIYDAVVDMVAETAAGRALEERLDAATFGALVEASLGVPEVARTLVEETSDTRSSLFQLALFRSWFDGRGSWSAVYVGDQYSKRDLRAMVRQAKAELARWPEIVKAVEAYERDSLRLGL